MRRAPNRLIRRLVEIWGPILVRWPRGFGLFEAILYLRVGSLEWLRRHRMIIGELERIRKAAGREQLRVLDFGGLSGSLAHAIRLYGLTRRYEIHVADIERETIEGIVLRAPLAGKLAIEPAPPLPCEDRSFDVVASSDVFEHIPRALRGAWADDLARVALLGQVHTIPCDSADRRWDSSAVDQEFASWYESAVGEPERWTTEHIVNGVPTIDELTAIFRPAQILGIANTTIWMDSMRVQFGRSGWLRRVLFVARYIVRRRADQRPPFKGCLVVVEAEREIPAAGASVGSAQSPGASLR